MKRYADHLSASRAHACQHVEHDEMGGGGDERPQVSGLKVHEDECRQRGAQLVQPQAAVQARLPPTGESRLDAHLDVPLLPAHYGV